MRLILLNQSSDHISLMYRNLSTNISSLLFEIWIYDNYYKKVTGFSSISSKFLIIGSIQQESTYLLW